MAGAERIRDEIVEVRSGKLVGVLRSVGLLSLIPVGHLLLAGLLTEVSLLASLVFALLALDELGPPAHDAVSVIAVTVVLSVLAHGVSAGPLASRYGRRQHAAGAAPPHGEPTPDLPVRGLPRRGRASPPQ